jgi:hypothetical protein
MQMVSALRGQFGGHAVAKKDEKVDVNHAAEPKADQGDAQPSPGNPADAGPSSGSGETPGTGGGAADAGPTSGAGPTN